jgi:hypothetical protein
MNGITLTIELCAEDRARIDRLTEALESRVKQEEPCHINIQKPLNDDINKMLKKALHMDSAETPKNAPEAPEILDHSTLDPFPETPTAKAEANEAAEKEAEPTVTMEMLTHKALTLSAAGKKDEVKNVIHVYAPKVTALPEDKWAEVYKKLCALEG